MNIKLKYLAIILTLLSLGCNQNPERYLNHVEGYWEIEKVILPNGEEKEYRFNETIDYIAFNDSLKGFRKKLKPGLNNTYLTSDNAENLTVKIEKDSLNIYYSTPLMQWKETVLAASKTQLTVINDKKLIYIYKRYQPINLDLAK